MPVAAGLEGLSPGTTYHYRLSPSTPTAAAEGADRTFRTASGPRLPGISSTAAREVGPTGASLRSRIDPNGGKTTYHFEYGLSQTYGSRTPERETGAGDSRVAVAETIGGPAAVPPLPLPRRRDQRGRPQRQQQPHLQHAPPADGRSRSRSRRRARTSARASRSSARVSGAGVNGIQVALERQDFPFAGPFSSIGAPAPIKADRSGRFRFYVPALFSATRLRALTRTPVVATSPAVTAQVGLRVGIATRRATRARGADPRLGAARRAERPRRAAAADPAGSWVFVRGASLRALGERRSRYGFKVRKRRAARSTACA